MSCSLSNSNQLPFFSERASTNLPFPNFTTSSFQLHSDKPCRRRLRALLSIQEIPPNALRRKNDPLWRGGFSLGVDLGLSRSGIALSKGFTVRPLTVLELRGQKLELRLLEIAENEEVDEFIIGLPKSWDGKETPQSNKVRSVAGRFAVLAAHRGWRVYLQDEHGTSTEATNRMIDMGLNKSTRQKKVDAYAAVVCYNILFQFHVKDI
ncbi:POLYNUCLEOTIDYL TRANSFERASE RIBONUCLEASE H-LIKE SUPERFAMILY PROTEIN [Salix koriyanagi]|uniref:POLYNUCLEOTIDYL TRANSFERASE RIBONUCLEASE H-LIKE SUPERFAMILY PROTEIN n=1 Tax=Salix koriyanagi TaxID=2511006 RepID=A0A9Q0T4V6_9ROSI|nr:POLYNUCLEOTIDYL TRANSFERASE RIBONUCLEASE H-LIKE SUPERFAMILY PROTEIN [Salix koriyanagi]